MFSLEECAPKRPPRAQKSPLASGTVQLDTLKGFASAEMSAIHTIWHASLHSLASEAEVADELRLCRVRQVVDLRHAARAPALDPRDEVGDAAVTLPEALVRAFQALHHRRDKRGLRRVGDVPDLVAGVAVGTQH